MTPTELIARREALGLSQTTLADALGVKQNTVSGWETGKRGIPDGIDGDLTALETGRERLIDMFLDGDGDTLVTIPVSTAPGSDPVPEATQRVAFALAQWEARAAGRDLRVTVPDGPADD